MEFAAPPLSSFDEDANDGGGGGSGRAEFDPLAAAHPGATATLQGLSTAFTGTMPLNEADAAEMDALLEVHRTTFS